MQTLTGGPGSFSPGGRFFKVDWLKCDFLCSLDRTTVRWSKIQDLFQRTGSSRNQGNHLIKRVADLRYCKTGKRRAHPIYYRFIKSKVTKIRLLSATRGARNPNVKVVITHAWHLYSQDWTVFFLFFRNVLWIKTIC